jgi:hypothetical protein
MRTDSAQHHSSQKVLSHLKILGTLILAMILLGGCGSKPTIPGAHLAGTVTVDGQPLQKGAITFTPYGNARGRATGAHIVDGRYDCPYVPLGEMVMQVNATRPTGSGKMVEAMGQKAAESEDIFFVKEDVAIKIQVRKDKLDMDFKLRSTKPRK